MAATAVPPIKRRRAAEDMSNRRYDRRDRREWRAAPSSALLRRRLRPALLSETRKRNKNQTCGSCRSDISLRGRLLPILVPDSRIEPRADQQRSVGARFVAHVDAGALRGCRFSQTHTAGVVFTCARPVPQKPERSRPPWRTSMAAYGIPPSLGVAPELMEEISTGVRDVPARLARGIPSTARPVTRDSNTSRTETDPPSPAPDRRVDRRRPSWRASTRAAWFSARTVERPRARTWRTVRRTRSRR